MIVVSSDDDAVGVGQRLDSAVAGHEPQRVLVGCERATGDDDSSPSRAQSPALTAAMSVCTSAPTRGPSTAGTSCSTNSPVAQRRS